MELINKDALVSEIEKLVDKDKYYETYDCAFRDGNNSALHTLKGKLDTLEVKEVDIEKELREFVIGDIEEYDVEVAKHFYELGLKTNQNIIKIGETKIYLDDDGGEPPYDGKQWLDLSCTEYEIPKDRFNDGDDVEILIRKI